jgi:hypothetical protein
VHAIAKRNGGRLLEERGAHNARSELVQLVSERNTP